MCGSPISERKNLWCLKFSVCKETLNKWNPREEWVWSGEFQNKKDPHEYRGGSNTCLKQMDLKLIAYTTWTIKAFKKQTIYNKN